ncbi:MAG: 2-dehydropantoate 2-reductase [Alteromonadaceae bacterium]|jgi:2-dehydropantoate 2-reductase
MAEHWHIIGRGSIGLLWAHQLNQLGHSVKLLVKNSTSATITQLQFTATTGEQTLFSVMVNNIDNLASSTTTINYLLVPLKAYDILPAIKQIKPYIHATTLVILCHNGMGTIEQVQAELGAEQPLMFVSTTHGAYRKNPQHVVHTGLGATKAGWINSYWPSSDQYSGKEVSDTINKILPPLSWHEDINQVLWQKLAINCVINPITAIKQCKNGELTTPRFAEQIQRLCQEISEVANHCGQTFTPAGLADSCDEVIRATAANFSSMNRDIAASRLTEIDYINGYLINKAQLLGIEVPENQALYQQIKALQSRSQ